MLPGKHDQFDGQCIGRYVVVVIIIIFRKIHTSREKIVELKIQFLLSITLGVKIRSLKVDFKTGGTWRQVGQ